jgi:putative membrane-bound dehydrogenase-like protein
MKRRSCGLSQSGTVGLFSALICALCVHPSSSQPPKGPLAPREELATFQVAKGFKVELVAAEPEVIDPVAMTFDEDGRLFVVEMRGYPNAGVGEGQPNLPGRIKLLEDKDGDGYFEKASVYVDNLRFPTGVCCWRGGILVGNAPDLIYGKDTDGDGKADVRQVLYTGFGQKNIQQLLNGLQFHFDNWVHGCNGSNDSVIRPSQGMPPSPPAPLPRGGEGRKPVDPAPLLGQRGMGEGSVPLRSRHFRFNPDVPGSLEPTSGGGQYGLAADDFGQWFTCTNSQHLRHIVLPDHYLRRNPHLAVPAVTHDIPDGFLEHGPAAKVHRISPFEAWRVERTSRRFKDPEYNRRLPNTELVPGGYITSATGLVVYRGGLFPQEYNGDCFVCDPANNLIHRDVLLPVGPTFIAKRHEEQRESEFLASTDNWFRPVFMAPGPDGAIYVADFYREIIETPLSLPEDIQKQYNLNSRDRGRIWRIAPEADSGDELKTARRPNLSKASDNELVDELAQPNAWRRLTAQRLLIERKAVAQATPLRTLAHTAATPQVRIHALWTMEGLGVLEASHLRTSLRDRFWQVREQALRLAETHFGKDAQLQALALKMVDDAVPRVRYQLAFSLGQMQPSPEVGAALARLAGKDGVNPWVQSAILSSSLPHAGAMLRELSGGNSPHPLVPRLATMFASSGAELELGNVIVGIPLSLSAADLALLEGLAEGLSRTGRRLATRAAEQSPTGEHLLALLKRAGERTADERAGLQDRLVAARVISFAPWDVARAPLQAVLHPQSPSELQLAAVQALGRMTDPAVAELLLSGWSSYSPAVRREVQEALFARPERLAVLLDHVEAGKVLPAHLDLARRQILLKHADAKLRMRAEKAFAVHVAEDRKKVLDEHRGVLQLMGDVAKGRMAFKKNCATCHRLENEGFEVGADLLSALKNKTPETLLIDILDPSREVDPRYLNYVAQTKDGRLLSGVIASETAASVLLRRAEKAEDTLLRTDIEAIQSTAKSLMPEGLEKQMTAAELADLIAYLMSAGGKR